MTTPSLLEIAERPDPAPVSRKKTRTSGLENLRRVLLSNRGRLFEIEELERLAGRGGWRTRISNLRKFPYYMDVENVKAWRQREDGTWWCHSRYRYNGPIERTEIQGIPVSGEGQ